jgi:hypothetical protein
LAVAGLTFWNSCFRLYAGTVNAPEVVEFLQAPSRPIPMPPRVVCDRLPARRSRIVQDYFENARGPIQVAYLRSNAPELNPAKEI